MSAKINHYSLEPVGRVLPPVTHDPPDMTHYLLLVADCLPLELPLSGRRSVSLNRGHLIKAHPESLPAQQAAQQAANAKTRSRMDSYLREIREKRPGWLTQADPPSAGLLPRLNPVRPGRRESTREDGQREEARESYREGIRDRDRDEGRDITISLCIRKGGRQTKPMAIRRADINFNTGRLNQLAEQKVQQLNREMNVRLKYGRLRVSTF
jgi:hypothetical protein